MEAHFMWFLEGSQEDPRNHELNNPPLISLPLVPVFLSPLSVLLRGSSPK